MIVSEATTAKRMKIDPQCHRRNCCALKVLFSDVWDLDYVDISGRSIREERFSELRPIY